MSRIRSQLDTIIDGPARAAADPHEVQLAAADVQRRLDERLSAPRLRNDPLGRPATGQSYGAGNPGGGQGHEIQRVRDQLDRLSAKLETTLNGNAGGAGRQSARQSQHAAEIGTDLDRLRADVTEIRAMLAGGAVNGELMRDMQRLGEAVSALQHPQETQNGQIATLAAEMRDIRRGIDELSRTATAPVDLDMSGVARSIESGYAEIAGRLEETVNRNFAETRGDQISGQIAEIGDQLSGLRDIMHLLPQQVDTAPLADRFGEVEGAIARLVGSGEDSLPGHLSHLEERLDEITRALIAISGNPDGVTNNLERIEARLATLSKTVDAIAENAQPIDDDEAGLASRFAGIAALPEELNSMVARIDARLDQLAESTGSDTATLQSLAQQLETIQNQLAQPSDGAGVASAESSDAFGAIEAQLGAIFARLDGLTSSDGGEAPVLSPDANAEIARSIDALMARLDATEAGPGLGEDGPRLQALEQQIGEIAVLLRGQADGEAAPIVDRLDSIEQQLANSRDIAIDMASQAAERAVQLAASSAEISGAQSDNGSDREFLEAMARDLQNIEARLAQTDNTGAGAGEAVQDALVQILDRLDAIERGSVLAPEGVPQPAVHAVSAPVAEEAYAPAATSSPDFLAEAAGSPAVEADTVSALGETDGEPFDADTRIHRIEESPPLDMEQLPELEPAVEDVPLEPGSGVPDLAALVRDASQKRKSTENPAADGGMDYLAAARRAAKIAASEAAASKDRETKKNAADGKPADERKGFGAALAKRRSLIMLVALVVLSVAMAGPLTTRFLGASQEIAAVETGAPASGDDDAANTGPEDELGDPGEETETSAAQPEDDLTLAAGKQTDAAETQTETGQQAGDETNGTVRTIAANAPDDVSTGVPSEAMPVSVAPEGGESQSISGQAIEQTAIPVPPENAGNTVLRQAASQGDPRAIFEIARRFTEGEGPDRDLAKAALWYEAAASRGYAPAQYRIGNFLEKGHGISADLPQSAIWYERAADRGNALAMHNLAVLHSTGLLSAQPDMVLATKWFTKAADLGVKDSQVNLGIIYAKGLGTDVDLVQSYKWFAIAAKGGDSDAGSKRDMVAEAMRPDQLETARGQTEIWKPGELNVIANVAEADPAWKDGNDQQASTDKRELVAQTQRLLTKLGFDPGPADGLFGERTRDAIMRFQEETGLPVDGAITPKLMEKLVKRSA